MAESSGPSADLRQWWRRHPWTGLYCGWLLGGALVLSASPYPPPDAALNTASWAAKARWWAGRAWPRAT